VVASGPHCKVTSLSFEHEDVLEQVAESREGITRLMTPIKKNASERQTQENEIHKALKAWYVSPGIQRELRNKENEAVQMVLEILERRLRASKG
jgi:hypothetical protein